jgi:hypothetical protein
MEFPRGVDEKGNPQKDGLRWYCPTCDNLVHEARWVLKKIDEDLKIIMEGFWGGPVENRTCKHCKTVIERAGTIALKGGKVTAAKAAKSSKPGRASKRIGISKAAKKTVKAKTAAKR